MNVVNQPDTFLRLRDTPDSYGVAGQPIKVNAAGDGLTFGSVTTVSALASASAAVGQTAFVSDGAASLAWGATVTGGGSSKYFVWSNGVNWTVVGK